MKHLIFTLFLSGSSLALLSQDTNTIHLKEVNITGYKTMNGVGNMGDYSGEIIYAGKKNEVIKIDSLDANKAINNTRQIIGRIPGLNIIETESGGFTANGIGFRGLNPYQSVETNTRQNGYTISADIFGYNEAYYLPPTEALTRIEFLRGASSLQFGPQIGGMINYVIRDAPLKPFEVTTSQTLGSYGLYNSFTSLGGTIKKFNYYGYLQYRYMNGWRENSTQKQLSGYFKVGYKMTSKMNISLEYSSLRNTIQMPGGLTDESFKANPKQSDRTRNWLASPWNVASLQYNYTINANSSFSLKTNYFFSQRNLIWRNEDGFPNEKDTITPSLTYVPRELERDYINSISSEARFINKYKIKNNVQAFSAGIRYANAKLIRKEGAEGSTGTKFDLTPYTDYEQWFDFGTQNIAFFAEHLFRVGQKLTITPGVRFEMLTTSIKGYTANEEDTLSEFLTANNSYNRKFLLSGIGLQYSLKPRIDVYANASQSYKPVTYSNLVPFGTIAKIDPNLKDGSANNIDAGLRGQIKEIINFDVSVFYLNYKNRIGLIEATANDGSTYAFRTNTGTSENKGVESYMELNLTELFNGKGKAGKISIYNSFALINARYISGDYAGNRVEYAPKQIERVGINYWHKGFACNAQLSTQSQAFGDAANTIYSDEALVGIIPAYTVIDFSASYKFKNYKFKFGVNNLTDAKYFTLRTDEYPGPGIIPSIGRMIYGGISATF